MAKPLKSSYDVICDSWTFVIIPPLRLGQPIPPVKRVVCTKAKSLMNTSQRLKALAFTTFKPIAFAAFAAP